MSGNATALSWRIAGSSNGPFRNSSGQGLRGIRIAGQAPDAVPRVLSQAVRNHRKAFNIPFIATTIRCLAELDLRTK